MVGRRTTWFVALGAAAAAAAPGAGLPSRRAASGEACRPKVSHSVIPGWARTGFSGPRPRVPYVLGRSGRIAAILFGYPLRSPAPPDRNNKILWVSRLIPRAPTALWIRAQRMRGKSPVGAPAGRVVRGGPGPSIVDLPAPGCWRLTLSWAGRTDTLDLAYSTGS